MYFLAQLFGILSAVVTIATPQFRTKIQILFSNALVNALSALNYAMLGETGSAVFLCSIAIVQSFVSMWHEKKQTPIATWETILFFILYTGFGFYGMITSDGFVWAITAHNLLQLLPIIGAVMLMFSVFAKTEQRTRFFLLLNGTSWLIYTAVIGSTVFFTCVAAIVSSITAMWKYRKTQSNA